MPINSRMDKLWYTYTMECKQQYKRTSNTVKHNNMGESKSLGTKENIPHYSIYMKF